MNRRPIALVAVPVLVVLCVLFYWKLVLTDQYVWFDHPDMCYLEIPRLQFQASEMHLGRFPLWDPSVFLGQPHIGLTQPGPLFPLNLLFFLLPLKDGYLDFRLLNWYFVVVRMLAALCAYALCRDLRRSPAASILAACAFAFGGFLGTVPWLDVANGAIWTPAICLFFLRAARGQRPYANAAVCGALVGLAWLSGHHEIPVMVSYALAAAWAFAVWRTGRRALSPAATTFLIAGLVGAAQIWPAWEFARLSKRWVGMDDGIPWDQKISYLVSAIYSMPVRGFLDTVLESPMRYADTTPFLGVAATALAGYGVCGAWRLAPVRWMTALAALSAAYALGAFTPLHGILYSIAPVLDKARIPVRAIHLFNFAIAVLAAYGLDRMLAGARQIPLRRFSIVLAVFGSMVVAIWMLRGQPEEGVAAGAIVALVLAALAAAWRHARIGRGTLVASVTFLMLTELYPVSTRHFSSRYDKNANKFVRTLTENKDIAARLREEPGPMRLFVHDRDMPANFGDWHGFDVVEGYMAGVSGNILRVGRHTTEAQRLYGVTHHIARKAMGPDHVDLYEGASGLKIFRTPGALPRAWSVHQVETVTEERLFDARIRDQSFDPARTALVMGAPPELEPCGGDDVKLVSRAPNRIRLHAAMQCRGLVVMSELFYPGWQATIDGKPAAIIEAYGSLRSLVVEKGDHAIEFVFRPISVYGGLALTLVGAVATALLVLWRHPEKPGPGKRVSATDARG